MIARHAAARLELLLGEFPAVALLGARQVGKTTLARSLAIPGTPSHYLDLERPSHLARVAEPELYLTEHRSELVILDEVQRVPNLFPTLRSLIDEHRRPGRFLLLGSASPTLLRQSSESLAGRLAIVYLAGLTVDELPSAVTWRTHWLRGGFPDAVLARSDAAAGRWMEAFTRTFIERDVAALGIDLPPASVFRLLTMLAHHHGQVHNASALARSLGVSSPTVSRYVDLLVGTFLVRALPAFHRNVGKRLSKRPKLYVRDSGLLHALLRIPSLDVLAGHPALGASFEGYVLENLAAVLPSGASMSYWRTHGGAELDLVVHHGSDVLLAVEVKYSATPKLGRGFHQSRRDVGAPPTLVVTPGDAAYSVAQDIEVCGLRPAMERVRALGDG